MHIPLPNHINEGRLTTPPPAPILELGSVLDTRGHEVQFATNATQEHWAPAYISQVHLVGPPIPSVDAEAHYERMRDWAPSDGMDAMMRSKRLFDALWPDTYRHLKVLCRHPDTRPDFIIADFFAEAAARDMLKQLNVPVAVMFPQMPYLMAPASYIPGEPGFQVDTTLTSEHASLLSRIRNELVIARSLPALFSWISWTKSMRAAAGVHYSLPSRSKPDYLVLVNSFFGLEVPKDLPPLIAPVGPILSSHYPSLSPDLDAFLETHPRTLFVSLGTNVSLDPAGLHRLLSALIQSLDSDLITGIIWSLPKRAIANLNPKGAYPRVDGSVTSAASILANLDPQILLTPFAPQRAILDHPNTALFLTHAGGSSANEALYHGCPVLAIGYFFDQLCNSARLEAAGVGLCLDKKSFTPDSITAAIETILTDAEGSFSRNVLRMRRLARIAARQGKHRAADLVEEVMYDHELRHDYQGVALRPMHLQTADMRMPMYKARNWDLWAIGLTTAGIAGIGCGWALWWISHDGFRLFQRAASRASEIVTPLVNQSIVPFFTLTVAPFLRQNVLLPINAHALPFLQQAATATKGVAHNVFRASMAVVTPSAESPAEGEALQSALSGTYARATGPPMYNYSTAV